MATRRLEPSEWKAYFDTLCRALPAAKVDILVTGADIGAQPETEGAPLLGLVWDPAAATFEIATADIAHRIERPREIFVQEGPEGLLAIEVVDDQGHKQIATLTRALTLPRA